MIDDSDRLYWYKLIYDYHIFTCSTWNIVVIAKAILIYFDIDVDRSV